MQQGALGAAGIRRVGYGLEVGCSVRTAGGAGGILCRHAHSLFLENLQKLKNLFFNPSLTGCCDVQFQSGFLSVKVFLTGE